MEQSSTVGMTEAEKIMAKLGIDELLTWFDVRKHPDTAPFLGILHDDAREAILRYVSKEQKRRAEAAEAFKRAIDLCAEDGSVEYKQLITSLSDAVWSVASTAPATPDKARYDEILKLIEGGEDVGSIELRLEEFMNGPALAILGLKPWFELEARGLITPPEGFQDPVMSSRAS